jgi:hypothetical protein
MARFKRNYLPSQSRPWGKQVEDALDAAERNLKTVDVNNRSKDEQFSASLNRLDAAVIEARSASELADAAQDAAIIANGLASAANTEASLAIQQIVNIGVSGGGTSVNADNISGGTISGNFINGGVITGTTISGDAISGGTITGTTISGDTISGGTITGTSISADSISGGTLSSPSISGGNINGASIIGGTLSSVGNVDVPFGTIFGYDINASDTLRTAGSIRRTQLNGGGTTGASVTSGGYFVRTSSSERYKTDIQLLDIDLNDLYAAQPKTFKRIEEVFEDPEGARTYPGFIAEDLAGTSLDQFVFYSEDEEGNSRPEGIHYPELTGALLIAIKDLNARIEALESN